MPKRYYIHDNGGRPFIVEDFSKDKYMQVYKQEYNLDTQKYNTPEHLFKIQYEHKWIGKKSKFQHPRNWLPGYVGNSILLRLHDNTHIYIGSEIYEFKPVKGDKIVEYYSDVGNNDVPYPFALGNTHIYYMLEKSVVKMEAIDLNQDVYEQLYFEHATKMCKNPGFANSYACLMKSENPKAVSDRIKELKSATKSMRVKILQDRI